MKEMKNSIQYIKLDQIKSKWHQDLIADWQPDEQFIRHLVKQIAWKEYLPPIVVVREGNSFYIVNGHHRYYAHVVSGEKKIKCILIEGSFEESAALRKAEVLLKEFDQKTGYRYQFSGYLDRWAAAAEEQGFINKFRPTAKLRFLELLKKIKNRLCK